MMKRYQHLLWVLVLLSFSKLLFGQADTLVTIPTIQVSADKIRKHHIGSQTSIWNQEAEPISRLGNIANLLHAESGVFIKSYGLNSLGTSSIRGGSAGHTLTLWNGLPLQSPMLGLLDLSLLPLQGAEQISLQRGGNTALWGSGAIGGILSLDNRPNYTSKTSIRLESLIGSFGEFSQKVHLGFGGKKIQSKTKYFFHKAENDFPYSIAAGFPKQKQSNAAFVQHNFLQDFYWTLKNNQRLAVHFWKQYSDREIPPLTTQNSSKAKQNDQANRLMLKWQKIGRQAIFESKIGLFNEDQTYTDEIIGLESQNIFTTLFAEVDGQWVFKKDQYLYGGLTHSFTRAEADAYPSIIKEHKTSIFASYRIDRNQWQLQTSLRQELIDKNFVPIIPALGFNYQVNNFLSFNTKISRNYRLPTLNDRYWNPGGNRDLLPEEGWSQEATILTHTNLKTANLGFSITGFNRNIDNWILWSRKDGQAFWSANNITKVWSRGLEHRLTYQVKKRNILFDLNLGYDYILSTNQIALERPNIPKGAQLFYTPKHKAFSKLKFGWSKFQAIYTHQINGATLGINENVAASHVGNLRLNYQMNHQQINGTIFININNIWGADYFIIERRPMPGTHFQTGINLTFNKKQK